MELALDLLDIESGYAHPRISAVSDPDLVSDRAMASPFSLSPSLVSALVVCAPSSAVTPEKKKRERERHTQQREREEEDE
jgi:hypothetical protein